jgi:hypothetical protein
LVARERRFVDVELLQRLAALIPCSSCAAMCSGVVKESTVDTALEVVCNACGHVVLSHGAPCVRNVDGNMSQYSEGNIRLVYHTLLDGEGFAGYVRLCVHASIPPVSSRTYYTNCVFVQKYMDAFMEEQRGHVLAAVSRAYSDLRGDVPAGVLSIDVSYDGTWMTRGHRSHIGAAFVIDCLTGFVVDFIVLSNFCEVCLKKEKSLSDEDFALWKETHTGCKKNFDGKAGAMEKAAAEKLWAQSEGRGYRYSTFVGDGDSSAFNAVKALDLYPVVKEECVNHVSKRLGTRLRNLKKDLKRPVTTKRGKIVQRSVMGGRGGLTDANIDKLTRHYGQNIRAHPPTGTVESLRKSILATYYHARSTDADPHHSDCNASWCWWKAAVDAGDAPDPHSTKNLYLSGLSPVLLKQVFLVYFDLTAPALLARCLSKRTQNPNESLHSKLWLRCFKVKNAQLHRVMFAASDTMMLHNFGDVRGSLLGRMGLASEGARSLLQKRDLALPTPPRQPKRRRVPGVDPATDASDEEYVPGGH